MFTFVINKSISHMVETSIFATQKGGVKSSFGVDIFFTFDLFLIV